ncbi:hypothetical protein SAY86_023435 [Trapa natans]|uniref:Uncharacterized protein n=1 Tax=Trapa natans TaxID=22666 RepID=A0AAN7MAQ9_TRANT|nr:hypothetical protein SAY86_023435 [Trapa natans]
MQARKGSRQMKVLWQRTRRRWQTNIISTAIIVKIEPRHAVKVGWNIVCQRRRTHPIISPQNVDRVLLKPLYKGAIALSLTLCEIQIFLCEVEEKAGSDQRDLQKRSMAVSRVNFLNGISCSHSSASAFIFELIIPFPFA